MTLQRVDSNEQKKKTSQRYFSFISSWTKARAAEITAYRSPLALADSSTRVGHVDVENLGVAHEGMCELFSRDMSKT